LKNKLVKIAAAAIIHFYAGFGRNIRKNGIKSIKKSFNIGYILIKS